ncbi:MAG: hypothetical protein KatS3mg110_0515 [Pirellulaceae bacterium]|nr:MAG: hypothetical protein KatS3mg110_0515 [Pirellulaceae bacterium]
MRVRRRFEVLYLGNHELKRLCELDAMSGSCSECERPWLALEAVRLLGPLSPWWLRPETLTAARQADSRYVPDRWIRQAEAPEPQYGLALVTCQWRVSGSGVEAPLAEPSAEGPRLLRPSLVLPLRWCRQGCDGALPERLLELAGRVRRLLNQEEYRITWGFSETDSVDARRLSLHPESAFFSLAGSLYLASAASDNGEVLVDPTVWITGAWDDQVKEVQEVSGIRAKVTTMLQFGARRIFVPAQNFNEARSVARQLGSPPDCVQALPLASDILAVLRPVLALLGVPPSKDAPWDDRKRYYSFLVRYSGPERPSEYYRRNLIDDVISRCGERLDDNLRRIAESRPVLITSLSYSPEMVLIAYRTFRPSRLVVLVSSYNDQPWMKFKDLLSCWQSEHGMNHEVREFRANDPTEAVREAQRLFEELARDAAGSPIVVDLTPGQKPTTIGLLLAHVDGVYKVYLHHTYDGTSQRPEAGTERYILVDTNGRSSGLNAH